MFSKIVLYAEDDPNDLMLFEMAFKRATLPHTVYTVDDGAEAVDWLVGNGKYKDRENYPIPNVLILDLKMPKKTGFEVLAWVRGKPELQSMPVLILSSSDEPSDVKRAYELGATSYFVKSVGHSEIIHYLRMS